MKSKPQPQRSVFAKDPKSSQHQQPTQPYKSLEPNPGALNTYSTRSTIPTEATITPQKPEYIDQSHMKDSSQHNGMAFSVSTTQDGLSPMSDDAIDRELLRQFSSFKQIDDLVLKQEELYNQIAMYQSKDFTEQTYNGQNASTQEHQDMKKQKGQGKMTKMQQRKTRNMTQSSGGLQAPYPNTVGSIYENNPSTVDSITDLFCYSKASLLQQLQQQPHNTHQNLLLGSVSSIGQLQHNNQNQTSSDICYDQMLMAPKITHKTTQSQSHLQFSSNSHLYNHDPTNLYDEQIQEQQNKLLQSTISSKTTKCKPSQVTERLLTIGKLYEAKKQKLKQEQEYQRKAQEDQIVQQVKRKYSRDNISQSNVSHQDYSATSLNSHRMPVEQRLNDIKKKYDMKAQERKKEHMLMEMQQMQKPQINHKSQRMLQNQSYTSLKVEDRLIEIGKKWQNKKEDQIKSYFDVVDSRAHPVVNAKDSNIVQVPKKENTMQNNRKLKSFEERLKDQMSKKEKMLDELKKKYEGQVIVGYQQMDRKQLYEFEMRQKDFQEQKKTNHVKVAYQEYNKFSFHPQINENSKRMVSSTSRERLMAHSTPNKHHFKCKPDRFSKSPTLTQRTISRRDSENDNTLNMMNDKYRARSKTPTGAGNKAEEAQFTFHPTINEKSKKMAHRQLLISHQSMHNQHTQPLNSHDSTQQHLTLQQNATPQPASMMIVNEPRWRMLYGKHFEIQSHKEEVKHKFKEMKDQIEQEQCTFKPNTQDTSWAYQNIGHAGEVAERNLVWFHTRQQRIQQLNEVNQREEIEGCTFHPQIVQKDKLQEALQADYSQLNTKSIEKYLERCNYAKQLKLEKELKEESKYGSGNKWKNTVTKSKAPSFMRDYYDQLKQLSPSPLKHSHSSQRHQKQQWNQDISVHNDHTSQNISHIHQGQSSSSHIQQTSDLSGGYIDNLPSSIDDNNHLLYTIQEAEIEHSKNNTNQYNNELFQIVEERTMPYQEMVSVSQIQQNELSSQVANSSKHTYTGMSNDQERDGAEFQNALHFLHEQLHKIEFSFDQA